MTWKPDVSEVLAITRKTVTEADITAAVSTVEAFTGVFLDVTRPGMSARDLKCLKNMTAYQAAWEPDQPDLATRSSVKSVSQDGNSATFTADGLTLAPFARIWLKRLSWRGTRSIAIRGATEISRRVVDDSLPWKPLA